MWTATCQGMALSQAFRKHASVTKDKNMAVAEHHVVKSIMQDLERRKQPLGQVINDLHYLRDEIAELRRRAPTSPEARQRIAKLEHVAGIDVGELAQRINGNIERLYTSFKALRASMSQGTRKGPEPTAPAKRQKAPVKGRKFI